MMARTKSSRKFDVAMSKGKGSEVDKADVAEEQRTRGALYKRVNIRKYSNRCTALRWAVFMDLWICAETSLFGGREGSGGEWK